MLQTDLGRLRVVSLLEGVSYLLLLAVAMPLKYLAGMPGAVHYVGWAHGVLFIALCLVLLVAWRRVPLSFGLSVGVFVAALVPFGPFVADRWLKAKAYE
ncbi:MAG: DUF3817 domain-containing protein [Planctomycetota bacterium]